MELFGWLIAIGITIGLVYWIYYGVRESIKHGLDSFVLGYCIILPFTFLSIMWLGIGNLFNWVKFT